MLTTPIFGILPSSPSNYARNFLDGRSESCGIIRLCLLTAQRRTKVAAMRWQDITLDGEWTIPREHREKVTQLVS